MSILLCLQCVDRFLKRLKLSKKVRYLAHWLSSAGRRWGGKAQLKDMDLFCRRRIGSLIALGADLSSVLLID